jgi:hypothetical protein
LQKKEKIWKGSRDKGLKRYKEKFIDELYFGNSWFQREAEKERRK